jgi:hypothetical protein
MILFLQHIVNAPETLIAYGPTMVSRFLSHVANHFTKQLLTQS